MREDQSAQEAGDGLPPALVVPAGGLVGHPHRAGLHLPSEPPPLRDVRQQHSLQVSENISSL